jgi:hypothetical protein
MLKAEGKLGAGASKTFTIDSRTSRQCYADVLDIPSHHPEGLNLSKRWIGFFFQKFFQI